MCFPNLSRTYPLTNGGAFALEDKYQYNQKEMNNDFGLLWNDYGARWYNPQLAIWHQIDPLAEKYAAWSGYNYVLGNPIRLVDPDGRDVGVAGDTDAFIALLKHVLGDGIEARLDESNKLTLHATGAAADDAGLTKDSEAYNNLSDDQKTVFDTFDEAIQDQSGTLNLSITDNSKETLIGGWGEKEQRIDPQDMMNFEKNSDGFVSAGALLAHEIKEGYKIQLNKNGYSKDEGGNAHQLGLDVQGKVDGYDFVKNGIEKGKGEYQVDKGGVFMTVTFGIKNNEIGKVTVTELKE